MKRAHEGPAEAPPQDEPAAGDYLFQLDDLTRDVLFRLEREPASILGPYDTRRMDDDLVEYYKRQSRIILAVVARVNTLQASAVQDVLSRIYSSSLEDYRKAFDLDLRPDFGEFLLYYVHHNNVPGMLALVAGAYDEQGHLLPIEKSVFNLMRVQVAFTGRRLRFLFRMAGRYANEHTYRTLVRIVNEFFSKAGQDSANSEAIVSSTLLGGLEMGRGAFLEALGYLSMSHLSWAYTHAYRIVREPSFRGLGHDPTFFGYLKAHELLPDASNFSPFYPRALLSYIRNQAVDDELAFRIWRDFSTKVTDEAMSVLREEWATFVRGARLFAQNLVPREKMRGFVLHLTVRRVFRVDHFQTLLAFVAAVFGDHEVVTASSDETYWIAWMKWAAKAASLHLLAAHLPSGLSIEDIDRCIVTCELGRFNVVAIPSPMKMVLDQGDFFVAHGGQVKHYWLSYLQGELGEKAMTWNDWQRLQEYIPATYVWRMPLLLRMASHLSPRSEKRMAHELFSLLRACRTDLLHPGRELWLGALTGLVDHVPSADLRSFFVQSANMKDLISFLRDSYAVVHAFTFNCPRTVLLLLLQMHIPNYQLDVWSSVAYEQARRDYGPRERAAALFFDALDKWYTKRRETLGKRKEAVRPPHTTDDEYKAWQEENTDMLTRLLEHHLARK